jgi:hypothetical protein
MSYPVGLPGCWARVNAPTVKGMTQPVSRRYLRGASQAYGARVARFCTALEASGLTRAGYALDRLLLHVNSDAAPAVLAAAAGHGLELVSVSRTQAFFTQKTCGVDPDGLPSSHGSVQVFASVWPVRDVLTELADRLLEWDHMLQAGEHTDLPALPDGSTASGLVEFSEHWDPADGRDMIAFERDRFLSFPFGTPARGSAAAQTFAALLIDQAAPGDVVVGSPQDDLESLLHLCLECVHLLATARALESPAYELSDLPLTDLLTTQAAMTDTLESGRISDTPADPILVKARDDLPGMWEIADGHHRVAAAMRAGQLTVRAHLDRVPDDEPLEPPFFDFAAWQREQAARQSPVRATPRLTAAPSRHQPPTGRSEADGHARAR